MLPSSRASSASSTGPFTPPMYVAGAYGAPQPVIPSRAPPSRRTSMPAPVSSGTGTIMHPVLELTPSGNPPILRYDLVDPPSGSALSLRSRDVIRSLTRTLDEAATSPPVSHLTIYCPHLPWTIRVEASSRHVTVNDVLVAIYHSLRRQLSPTEYALLQNGKDRDRAAQAYRDRYKRLRDGRAYDAEQSGGMRRVDFLMEKTRFGGLSRGVDAHGREGWMLAVYK